MSARFGELGLSDTDADDYFELFARLFFTMVHFLPPEPGGSEEELAWRVAEEDLAAEPEEGDPEEDLEVLEILGPVSVAQVLQAAPTIAHAWILEMTEVLVADMLQSEFASEKMAGLRLRAEWEEGKAAARDRPGGSDHTPSGG